MSIDVMEMVRQHLVANGYEGLVNDDLECGCDLVDLAPCGEMKGDCLAGHCIKQPKGSEFDFVIYPGHRNACQPCQAGGHDEEQPE